RRALSGSGRFPDGSGNDACALVIDAAACRFSADDVHDAVRTNFHATLLISPETADNRAMEQGDDTQAVEEAEEVDGPPHEQQEIMRWRFTHISALGIGQLDAQLLAETGADLGLLRRLVGQGCPPPLAVRIVL